MEKPYVYAFEQDEPVRIVNRKIVEKLGFKTLRLETDEVGDGTKLWFAVKKEADALMEETKLS